MAPTPSTPAPTGRRHARASGTAIVFERRFEVAAEEVWAAITDPTLLERWIGTWSGDPASGRVAFRMTSEGDDVGEEPVTITDCVPREHLALSIGIDGTVGGTWRLDLSLAPDGAGRTVLAFAQLLDDASGIGDIAPGWEYYLDRLAAVLGGGDVAAIRFEDYHPGQSEHYRAMFA